MKLIVKKLPLAGCLLLWNACLWAQSMEGMVMAGGLPLPAATVVLKGSAHAVVADSNGHFIIDAIGNSARLQVSAVGYEPLDTIVKRTNGQVVLIYLRLAASVNEEVVVSGTMKAISKMASPILVEVYSPAFFKKNPTPNIFEGLQLVNGVQPQLNCNVCNTGDIHINGMEGAYTMILIDGMPIVSSLATVYGLSGIPNSMVKRIEIVKGPASTLYGSEAVGGLINIITKDALQQGRFQLDLSATRVGELAADISCSYKLGKVQALTGASYFNYQQRRDLNQDNFTDIALQNRLSIFNKGSLHFGANGLFSLAARYIYEDRWGGEMQWKPQFRGSDEVYGESIQTNRVELISTTSFTKSLLLDFSYNYHRQQSYYGRVKYFADQQVAFAQLRWNKKMNRHELLAGIPLRYTWYDDNTAGTAALNGQNQPDRNFLPGIFLQDQVDISKKLVLLAGMRYDHSSRHGSILTPRLSVKISPNTDHSIRLSAGNGYRVVNLFTEDHAALTGAREVVVAAALKPERSWNGNINYNRFLKSATGFFTIDLSVFYTYFSNKIVADYFSDATKIIYNNLSGYAVSKGITLNVEANCINRLKITAGATLMDVYQVDKDAAGKETKTPQLFAPAVSGTYTISYPFVKQGLTVDVTGRFTGSMQLPVVPNDFRDAKSPFYNILNIQFTQTLGKGWECYSGIKNILNFVPRNPILHPDDPFNKPGGKYFDADGNARSDSNPYGYSFDPSYNYASLQGIKFFAGLRWQLR